MSVIPGGEDIECHMTFSATLHHLDIPIHVAIMRYGVAMKRLEIVEKGRGEAVAAPGF